MRRRQWAGCTRWEGSCSSSPRLTPAATPKPPPLRPIRTAPRPSLPSLAPRPAPSARRRWRAGRARAPLSGRCFAFATIPRAACWAALAAAAAAAGRSRAPFCARQAARDATGRTDQCARSLAPPGGRRAAELVPRATMAWPHRRRRRGGARMMRASQPEDQLSTSPRGLLPPIIIIINSVSHAAHHVSRHRAPWARLPCRLPRARGPRTRSAAPHRAASGRAV